MRTKSIKPKKQRKYQFATPKHEIHKVLSSNLSPSLRESKGFRSIPIRKGDTVTITRGDMKGKSGKITKVDLKKQRVFVDKVVKRKTDNTEIPMPLHTSNLMITKLVEKDRSRLELINRRIKDEKEKMDIDAILAVEEEEDDIIEIEDDDLDMTDVDDEEVELLDEAEVVETPEDDVSDEETSEEENSDKEEEDS